MPIRDPLVNKLRLGTARKTYQIPYGVQSFGSTKDVPYCSDPDLDMNLEMAFRKRLCPVLPKGELPLYKELEIFVGEYLRKNFHPLPLVEYSREVFEEWLSHTHYDGPRIEQLEHRYDVLESKKFHLTNSSYSGEIFPKREFYEGPKDVRMINSRSDEFKVKVGPYIKMIEDQVYKDPHFVKGIPIDQLPHKLIKLKPWDYIIETDYSSFESSFSYEYVKVVEMQMFRYFLVNNPEILSDVLNSYESSPDHERVQKLYSKRMTAHLTGCRLSGELWTSLGNGFSNLMNMLFLCKIKNIKCDGFVEGDDGLFGVSEPSLTKEDFARLGFVIKMDYVNQVQDTTFCGNTFSDQSMKLLINPENIGRMFWTCSPTYLKSKPEKLKDLFRSKAASMYVTGRFTPVAGHLAFAMLQRFGKGKVQSLNGYWRHEIAEYFKTLSCVPPIIAYSDRVLYAQKFQLPISDQLMLEDYIKNCDNPEMNIPYQFMTNNHVCGVH